MPNRGWGNTNPAKRRRARRRTAVPDVSVLCTLRWHLPCAQGGARVRADSDQACACPCHKPADPPEVA